MFFYPIRLTFSGTIIFILKLIVEEMRNLNLNFFKSVFTKFLAILLLLSLLVGYLPIEKLKAASLTNTGAPAGFQISTVVTGLTLPTAASFTPDGRIFVAQKNGVVKIFKNGVLLAQPFYTVANVNNYVDRGLLGLAIDPNFSTNGFVYLLFTFDNDPANPAGPKTGRLIRVTASGDTVVPGSEQVILGNVVGSPTQPSCENFAVNTDCLPADGLSHAPGTVAVAPDGKLFVSVGDGAGYDAVDPLALRSQNLNSYAGKILRINPDGTAPTDNPFYNSHPTDTISKVWAYGVRNSFRLNVRQSDGALFAGEVGWNKWEEVNYIKKGSNLGWPCWEGTEQQSGDGNPAHGQYKDLAACQTLYQNPPANLQFPLYYYPHPPSSAVVGGMFYTGNNYPAQYKNKLFFGDYAKNQIYNLSLDTNNNLVPGSVSTFASNVGGPVDFFTDNSGDIYYVAIMTGSINKVTYSTGNLAPNAVASSDKISGSLPLTINFSSSGSADPENGPLGFSWNFGDGSALSTVANPSHTYTTNGTFTATLTVSDDHSNVTTANVTIYAGVNSPIITINTPNDFSTFNPGDVVTFSGSAFDPQDGQMSPSKLNWQTIIHHCPLNDCHDHFLSSIVGAGGSFVFPAHDKPFYIEIILTVTDSIGLTSTKSISIYPTGDPINHAVSFDGVNDFGKANNSVDFNLQQMTVEAWFHSLTTDTYGGEILSQGNNWGLRLLPDGNLRFFFNSTTGWKNFETTGLFLKDGVWHHVATVRSATQVKLFVDGVLKTTFNNSDQILYNLGADLILGKHGQTDDNFAFAGTIDEVRVWNSAKSDADIFANYNKVLTTQAGLKGYWRFEEGNNTQVADLSNNNHDVTLINGPVWTAGIPLSVASPPPPPTQVNKSILVANGSFASTANTADLKLNQFTIETYVKASGIGLYGGEIISLGNNWGLRILWDGNLRFFTRNGLGWDNFETVGVNVLDNTWHQIAVSRSNSTSIIYVDGVVKLTAANLNPTIVYSVANDLVLGKHGSGDNNFNLDGQIDEVRLWNTVRTLDEINNAKNSEINPASTGLLLYYSANDGSGTNLSDLTNKNHSASLSSAVTWADGAPVSAVAAVKASIYFDGVDDQAVITGNSAYNLQSFSLETWVKVQSSGLYGGEAVSNGNNWGLRILKDGNIRFFFHLGNLVWRNLETTSINLNDNVWHQIGVVKTSSTVKIYVDGVLKSTFTTSETISYTLSPNLVLGRHASNDNRFNLQGNVDEFRLWNQVLTDSDVANNFNKEVVLPQTNLVGYWRFNDNTGTLAADLSPLANSAVLQNGVVWGLSAPLIP